MSVASNTFLIAPIGRLSPCLKKSKAQLPAQPTLNWVAGEVRAEDIPQKPAWNAALGRAINWGSVLVFGIVLVCSFSDAATIRKTDDSTITGDITSIDDSKLTVAAKPRQVVVPFEDIAQIVFKAPAMPAPPPPPPTPVVDNNSANDDSPGLLGMLFGPSKPHAHVEAVPAVPPASQPVVAAATTKPATTAPVGPDVQVALTDGDAIHAKLASWSDQKIQLKLASGQSLELPSTAITEIWIGTQDLQKKARAIPLEAGPEDVAFVAKENDIVIVKGLAQGVTGGSLQFRYGDEDRKIGLGKIVGLLLRGNAPAPMSGFHQCVHTDNGDQFSGSLSALDHDYLTLIARTGPLRISTASITTVDFVNGRVTSLCDLKPAKVEQIPYLGRVIPYRIDHSLTGGPLILSDGPCARGIAVHSRCVLSYELPGDVDRFKTRLGFQQPEGLHGRVAARVLGDGKVLYENPDARGDQPPIEIDVPLSGVKTLTLEIDFGKDQDVGDRVVWANPRLIRGEMKCERRTLNVELRTSK